MQKQIKIMLFVLWLVGILAVVSLASFSVASAQEPTVTPSPSASPSQTPTAFSVSNDCPEGDPIGWGVYTPSALWMLECAHCVNTPTPTATIIPTLDGTAYPTEFSQTATAQYLTGTPTPTYTPTPIPYSDPLLCRAGNAPCAQIDNNNIVYSGNTDWYNHAFNFNFTSGAGVIYARYVIDDSYGFIFEHIPDVTPEVISSFVSAYNLPEALAFEFPAVRIEQSYSGIFSGVYDFAFTIPFPGNGMLSFTSTGLYSSKRFAISPTGTLYLSYYPFDLGTPTPTPSPVNSICYSVVPDDTEYFGFDLFQPDGVINCDMGWDAFTVGSYEVPAVEICFQPSRFGVITLFGNEFEVGIFALVVAAAFLYRYFRTSS